MVDVTKPIVESKHFIILEKYTREWEAPQSYQTENELERELVDDLVNQGIDYLPDIKTPQALLANVRTQLQALNHVHFSDTEWQRFVETWLDAPSDGIVEKTRKVHDNYIHDFVFDDGRIQNLYLFDKKTLSRNKVQAIRQFEQTGSHANRYDVTILVNGLPLVQVELKKRGIAIREAFNQVHRYSKESFNSTHSLYKYLQLFVISNGTDTRYFANTTQRNKHSFDFTIHWASADNTQINDLKDFTATFFQKRTLLNVLLTYSVFDTNNTLLIMRPYQIAATERMLWKINATFQDKHWNKPEGGGYIWHTTGSGKTLTSFKAARLVTQLDFIDKVFFVVDRKDLDYQTMKEYQRFSPDSVNGSDSTTGLKRNLAKDDNKIIVTTIQKLGNLMRSETDLPIYRQRVVFIFDECHRSQFGEMQRNLKKKFKQFCQFGFTGTPIFQDNALGSATTASVFGPKLHSYVITDAIRDEKVLKFKVDYNNVHPRFKSLESEQDDKNLDATEYRQALLHPDRILEITRYILSHFRQKTHRLQVGSKGFNAMFAVSSVDAAKLYYETFKSLQQDSDKPLTVATIFSFAANEEQHAHGDIADEGFEISALDSSAKEFLSAAIADYNALFKTSFSVDSKGFQNYYRDLAKRVKDQDIDLLIVVGMFLTGFDAPTLNTLFVDKNLRYHGLIQAYSRTNRIYDATKTFGNIVTFRDLEQATIDAITLFGDANTRNTVLERGFLDYIYGFSDNGKLRRGFMEVVNTLKQHFPAPTRIDTDADKKSFVLWFGQYLRLENTLQNYDEFAHLKDLQKIDADDAHALAALQTHNHITDESLKILRTIPMLTERQIQDYCSTYNDIRGEPRPPQPPPLPPGEDSTDWNDVVFEVELLKSLEINLDYILELIFKNKTCDKTTLLEDVRRALRASLSNRAKESLLVDFIQQTDFDQLGDRPAVIAAFFDFARIEQQREAQQLIDRESLQPEAARRYLKRSLKREFASDNGTELNAILPRISPLNPQYLAKKQDVFQQITAFVEKFKGVGGTV